MYRLGEVQKLQITNVNEHGAYLTDGEGKERILLPGKQIPEGAKRTDYIDVFVYRDSEDRLIATTQRPYLMLGEVGELQVVSLGKVGAFLDWGLERDIFLPFREQTKRVQLDERVLVAIYLDKSSRLAATMNVYRYLENHSPYHAGDDVEGTIYETSQNYGLFVAVDGKYSALLPKQENYGGLAVGDRIRARVSRVRDDGRLDLSVRAKAREQMAPDMDAIMELLKENGGVLPFTENDPPEVIRHETGMSKKEFKRAVGHLYKRRKVTITDGVIRLAPKYEKK